MEIINKFEIDDGMIVLLLSKLKRGSSTFYQVNINDKTENETRYCYEFNNEKEVKDFFESMCKHIYSV